MQPQVTFNEEIELKNKKIWNASLLILAVMVVFFVLHHRFHWQPWFVALLGMSLLIFVSRKVVMDHALDDVEFTLLLFIISLFMVVGGVTESGLFDYLGRFIAPFVREDLLLATIILMWFGAFLSALIDNIPFTAAMVPIILAMEENGINVTPLWWALAIGVGMGGNGTHIGSTANVFIVTISEKLARQQQDETLRITPWLWFKKATPVMILTLVVSSLFFILFWGFFSGPSSGIETG